MVTEERAPAGDAADIGAEPPRSQRILVVDDEADILESLKDLLVASIPGLTVETAISGPDGLAVLKRSRVDLIITDYKMPGMNGLEFLQAASKETPGVPKILVTAFPDLQIAIRAINEAGITNFFTKPFDPSRVIEVVSDVLRERKETGQRSRSFARSLDVLRRRLDKDE